VPQDSEGKKKKNKGKVGSNGGACLFQALDSIPSTAKNKLQQLKPKRQSRIGLFAPLSPSALIHVTFFCIKMGSI
jgi:hypothetical protein